MAKPKKTPRPKAETPKGFRDYFGAEVTQRAEMLHKIAQVYHRYGFDALESSGVETVQALGKFLPDVDRPNEGVFAWQEDAEADKPGDWLALRYDLTAPLARVYAQHRNDLPTPYRRYAMGPVWRNEKPGPGRFRQFYQCDADTVGTSCPQESWYKRLLFQRIAQPSISVFEWTMPWRSSPWKRCRNSSSSSRSRTFL